MKDLGSSKYVSTKEKYTLAINPRAFWGIRLLWLLWCAWHFPSAQQQFVTAFSTRKTVSGRLSDARSATAGRCHLQTLLTFLPFIYVFLLYSPWGKIENGLKLIELMSFGKNAEIHIFHKTTNEMHAGYSLTGDSEDRNAQMQYFSLIITGEKSCISSVAPFIVKSKNFLRTLMTEAAKFKWSLQSGYSSFLEGASEAPKPHNPCSHAGSFWQG